MTDAIITVLCVMSAMVAIGAGIVVYIIWRSNRRMDDAVAEAAKEAGES